MIKRVAAVVFAVASVLGLGLAAAQPAAAESDVPCIMAKYSDGRNLAWVCLEVQSNPGPTWFSGYRLAWNPPLGSGGHSGDYVWFCNYGGPVCVSQAGDGATREEFSNYTIADTTTHWVEVYGNLGGVFTCRRVFANDDADMAVTGC